MTALTTAMRSWITLCEAMHPLARPRYWQAWGASHSNSWSISGEAARLARIPGYQYEDAPDRFSHRLATAFLKAILNSPGSSEPLYHGFLNRKHLTFHTGQIIELPLMAASGDIDNSAGYGLNRDQDDPTVVFEFPSGTPMAGYARWNKGDAKDFGHTWSEALVAGRFRVVGEREQTRYGWSDQSGFTIITLEPVAVFDPRTAQWVSITTSHGDRRASNLHGKR